MICQTLVRHETEQDGMEGREENLGACSGPIHLGGSVPREGEAQEERRGRNGT